MVGASPQQVWDVLTDPALLARLTPLLRSIDQVSGDDDEALWRWRMSGLTVLGRDVGAPEFTERMRFDEHRSIDFEHTPPEGAREWAGARGHYGLVEVAEGTHLTIGLEVEVDLPLPRAAGPAVSASMTRVIASMGDRFGTNLCRHLGVG